MISAIFIEKVEISLPLQEAVLLDRMQSEIRLLARSATLKHLLTLVRQERRLTSCSQLRTLSYGKVESCRERFDSFRFTEKRLARSVGSESFVRHLGVSSPHFLLLLFIALEIRKGVLYLLPLLSELYLLDGLVFFNLLVAWLQKFQVLGVQRSSGQGQFVLLFVVLGQSSFNALSHAFIVSKNTFAEEKLSFSWKEILLQNLLLRLVQRVKL